MTIAADYGTFRYGDWFAAVLAYHGGTLEVASGATVDLNNQTVQASHLVGSGTIRNGATGAASLIVGTDATADSTFSGTITDGAGQVGLIADGGRTLTLTGTNGYTGGTTINAGSTLQIGNGGTTGSIVGDVSNNGVVAFSRSDDLIFAGAISGAGTLAKSGSNTLTLTGSNTYTGDTIINAGTLQVGNGGSTGSITGSVTNQGTLAFNRSTDYTYGGTIIGSGNVVQKGLNTLTLNGVNTYTGGTTIDSGTLAIGNMNALGTGDVTLRNGAELLSTVSGTDGFGYLNVYGSGRISAAAGQAFTVAGFGFGGPAVHFGSPGNTGTVTVTTVGAFISGFGSPMTLAVDYGTFRYGDSFVASLAYAGGTLDVASGATVDLNNQTVPASHLAGSGTIQNGAAGAASLIVGADAMADSTFSGTITDGAGQVTLNKEGSHVLTLAGNNTYTGDTIINAGTLQVGNGGSTGSISGGVTNQGTLAFNRSTDYTYGGKIIGSGNVVQKGLNTLTLNGVNTYTGGTTIDSGTLAIGSMNALGTGDVTLQNGAELLSTVSGTDGFGNLNVYGSGRVSAAGGQAFTVAGLRLFNRPEIRIGSAGNTGTVTLRGEGGSSFPSPVTIAVDYGTFRPGDYFAALLASLGGTLDVASGATVDLNNQTVQASQLAGAGAIQNGAAGAASLVVSAGATGDSNFSGTITNGAGQVALKKEGSRVLALNGTSTYSGGTTIDSGTLAIGSMNALGTGDVTLRNGAELLSTVSGTDGFGSLNVYGSGRISAAAGQAFTVAGFNFDAREIRIGSEGKTGTVSLMADFGPIAFAPPLTLAVDYGTFRYGDSIAAALANHGGALDVASGATVDLNDQIVFASHLAGSGAIQNGAAGAASLIVGADATADSIFSGTITDGAGQVKLNKEGTHVLTLTGSSTYSGGTVVDAGTLAVNGSVAGDVQVNSGATLGGSGAVGGNVTVASGATLSPGKRPGTLTVGGDLNLQAGSSSVFQLGQSGAVGGASNDLVDVRGNLTLGGALQASAASAGWYRIFDYGGSLAGGFASTSIVGSQAGFALANATLDTSAPGQVNLSVLGTGQTLQFWNGSQSSATGSVAGGSGTWGRFGTNWTDSSGTSALGWGGSVAVFGGVAGGSVSVTDAQAFDTLQFSTDGYSLTAGSAASLAIAPATGSSATINTGPGIGASIGAAITNGSGNALVKVGSGTLTLSGANTYTGGTAVIEGTLVAAADDALGSGGVTVNNSAGRGATLQVSQGVSLANGVALANGGTLDNAGTVSSRVDGTAGGVVNNHDGGRITGGAGVAVNLAGGGSVSNGAGATIGSGSGSTSVQSAGGALVLSNAGHLVGDVLADATEANAVTLVSGGTLQGNLRIGANTASTLTLDGASSSSGGQLFSQAVTGTTTFAGQLVKRGTGTWVLDTPLAPAGTTIDAGTLQVGNGGTTGALGAGAITNNGTLAFNRSDNLTVGNTISGSGEVRQAGTGTLTLTGSNSYTGGTALKGGTLVVGSSNALGSGTLSMDDNTTLALAVDGLSLANAVVLTGTSDPTIDTGAFTARLTGGISGAAELTKTGSGTLVLGAANNRYSGATTVAAGTLQAGAANAFSPASAYAVASGATLDLAGYSQRINGLSNSGSVRLTGAAPGTVLTVTGPWVGQGGTLALGTQLGGNASPSDKLLLSGTAAVASGSTQVRVTNLGGLGGQTTGNGIEIVGTEAGASIQAGAFALAGTVAAGAYDYRLNTTATGAYLSSTLHEDETQKPAVFAAVPTYRPEAALFAALPEQLRQAGLAMVGNLHQRVGDDSASGDSMGPAGQGARQAWGRIISIDPEVRQGGTVSPASEGRLTGFQAGTDLWGNANWRAGLYVGQLDGDMEVTGFVRGANHAAAGSNDLQNQYLAAYATWRSESGLYADGVLQGARHRYTAKPALAASSDGRGSSVLGSIEVGQSIQVAPRWVLEPQLQLVGQNLSLDDTDISGARVQHDAHDGWTARAGLRVRGAFDRGAGTVQPYARVNFYKRSGGSDNTRFIGPAATADIAAPIGGTSSELAAGATWQVGPATSLYGDIGKLWASGGGDARVGSGVSASLGLKMRW